MQKYMTSTCHLSSDIPFYLVFQSNQVYFPWSHHFVSCLHTWCPVFLASGLQCLAQFQIHDTGVLNPEYMNWNLRSPWNWCAIFCANENMCICHFFLGWVSIKFHQILKVDHKTSKEVMGYWRKYQIRTYWIEFAKFI